METVVFDETPLAEYLKDEGDEQLIADWAHAEPEQNVHTPPPSPPSPSFAPVGRPMVKKRFRNKIPLPLRVDVPRSASLASSIENKYARAVASRIERADGSKFLEQFRYTVIASQLLSGHSILGQHHPASRHGSETELESQVQTAAGLAITALTAVAVAWVLHWVYEGGYSHLTKKRFFLGLCLVVAVAVAGCAYIRHQWLRYVRESALREITTFVARCQDFDSATSAAVGLVQEVELVSRGYRISAPLPPISRIEDRSQTRRCVRLRKALRACFSCVLQKYSQTSSVIKGFAEQLDLEKYYDIYDISDLDISDALQGFSESEFEDAESLRTLKIVAARFHTIRKMFLCSLLALDANGDDSDFLRWTTAVEGLRDLNEVTQNCYERLGGILGEEESFTSIPTPKMPYRRGERDGDPNCGSSIRYRQESGGLQAKLTLLREESDRSLNKADDVSELGPNLMGQYESIGQDLRTLVQAWEEGKATLASGIDRNEKRLSSISTLLLSPAFSLSGLTTVEEGGAAEALKALTGESPLSANYSPRDPESEEIFEAVALPRPKSLLTREERIAKMKDERERKAEAREQADANRGMLRELEMVINLRPKGRSNSTSNTEHVMSPSGADGVAS